MGVDFKFLFNFKDFNFNIFIIFLKVKFTNFLTIIEVGGFKPQISCSRIIHVKYRSAMLTLTS